MKNILFLIVLLFGENLVAQKYNVSKQIPESGNYLMSGGANDSVFGNFIFEKQKMVYYGYNRQTKIAENPYKTSAKMVKELFDYALKINFMGMTSLDETKVDTTEPSNYMVIECRMDGEVKRICWDKSANDETSQKLNDLLMMMNGFW